MWQHGNPVELDRRQYGELLENTFSASFTLPFDRTIIFDAITDPRPLGLDNSKVQVTFYKSWTDSSTIPRPELGCIRDVHFLPSGGRVLAQLVELDHPRMIQWEEIESSGTQLRMLGTISARPTYMVQLEEHPAGTEVTLTYNFHRVEETISCFGLALCKSRVTTANARSSPLCAMHASASPRSLQPARSPC